jgi:hypothetical protein
MEHSRPVWAALVQLRDLIITAPAELRETLSKRKTLEGGHSLPPPPT